VPPTATNTPVPLDSDGDGVSDEVEVMYGSSPGKPDQTPEHKEYDLLFGENSCSDNKDNDADGLFDLNDPGCQ
jgi:hypothetical protein